MCVMRSIKARRAWVLFDIGVLVCALAVGAGLIANTGKPTPRSVAMPSLVGLTTSAAGILTEGLRLDLHGRNYGCNGHIVPMSTVLAQSPAAGISVQTGSVVWITARIEICR